MIYSFDKILIMYLNMVWLYAITYYLSTQLMTILKLNSHKEYNITIIFQYICIRKLLIDICVYNLPVRNIC